MLSSRPRARALALVALVAGSALAAPVGRVAGVTVTGDRLVGCAAVLAAAALLLAGRVRFTAVHAALAVFVAVQAITTLARAATWPQGLKFVTVYALGFGCFVVAAELARGAAGRAAAVRAWIATGAAVGALGAVLAFAASATQTSLWGTGMAQMLPIPGGRPVVVFAGKATFPEWNLLSSYLLVALALALWGWSAAPGRWLALAGIAAGLVFGVTRAAWVAMAAIALAWLLAARPGRWRVAALAVLVAVPLIAQGAALGASPLVTRVVQPVLEGSDWNLITRGLVNRTVARSWRQAPALGQGAGSSNRLSVILPGGHVERRLWSGNLELFVLHDSGVVGLVALAGVVAVAGWTVRRGARRGAPGWRELGWPLGASALALLWAWQFTHALWLMYPYVFLGLLVACAEADGPDVAPRAPRTRGGAPA